MKVICCKCRRIIKEIKGYSNVSISHGKCLLCHVKENRDKPVNKYMEAVLAGFLKPQEVIDAEICNKKI
jgi:hypothetical protein